MLHSVCPSKQTRVCTYEIYFSCILLIASSLVVVPASASAGLFALCCTLSVFAGITQKPNVTANQPMARHGPIPSAAEKRDAPNERVIMLFNSLSGRFSPSAIFQPIYISEIINSFFELINSAEISTMKNKRRN